MKVSPELFHAYLKCPTKCWLRATHEPESGNAYAEWVKRQNERYRAAGTERLVAMSSSEEVAAAPDEESVKTDKWRLATNLAAHAQSDSWIVESELHSVERVTSTGWGKAAQFIPIRFIFTNKLGKEDKLLLAFDAFVFSKSQGSDIKSGRIIHGDDNVTLKVNTSVLTVGVRKHLDKIAALLSNSSPPDLVLNRHCAECEFQARCRKITVEKDDLSLLAGMSAKERKQLHSKGIFTVTQFSYTFRPRRPQKRAKNPAKPRFLALQALAIRENTVYFHGTPTLPQSKTHIYLDIEGLPDRDFYYLIGIMVVSEGHETFHSFWADTQADESAIFAQCADTISQLEDFRVFHYGDYDSAAWKRMRPRLSETHQEKVELILGKCTNVLSALYPHVYFPTFSNRLKDIGRIVGHDCSIHEANGLHSIILRTDWEVQHKLDLKSKLIEYNRTDCVLLKRLSNFIEQQGCAYSSKEDGATVRHTKEMIKERPPWQMFAPRKYALEEMLEISKCAYFDYQREKVLVRTHRQFKAINRKHRKLRKTNPRPNETILLENKHCPQCRNTKITVLREMSHILIDLKFSRTGVKRWLTEFCAKRYRCSKCRTCFSSEDRSGNPRKYGHGIWSWALYMNIGCGMNMSRVAKSLGEMFKLYLDVDALFWCRRYAVDYYENLYKELLRCLLCDPVLHVDETTVHLSKGQRGYVWVLTSADKVYYFYRSSREGAFLEEILRPFSGVLVSDFYTAYDSLPYEQQKCLVHLVRDIDDDLLKHPLDIEFKDIAANFGSLLKAIVQTADQYGLKKRHLHKHKREVLRFLESVASRKFVSELGIKYQKRFHKSGSKMFTFLDHDGVPWNNNNAEHAIKRFAKHRRDANGKFTETSLTEYLILASVLETCEFNNVNVLDFLLSKETTLNGLFKLAGRRTNVSSNISCVPDTTQASSEIP